MHQYKIIEKGKALHEADKALILLHGRGGSAADILALAGEFDNGRLYIAAPQATHHTWYPYGFMAPREANEPWLQSAVETVKRLIDTTAGVTGTENIYLMGFSQGACLALETACRYAAPYAGIAAFTGGLMGQTLDRAQYSGGFAQTPVFIGNSDHDPHVPLQRSEESKSIMEQLGAKVSLEVYPGMPHTITRQEIQKVRELMF